MACEIKITKGEEIVFDTEYFNFSRMQEFCTLFLLLDKKFPEEEGFELFVMRGPYYMPAIERKHFKAACQSGDWKDPIRLFVLSPELKDFRGSVRIMNLDEAYYHIDNLKDHVGLSAVRCYEGGATIFEIAGEQTLFKILGHVEFESTHLQSVEYELYLSFLRYLDPFPDL